MNARRAKYFDSLSRFVVKKREPNVTKLKVVIGRQTVQFQMFLTRVLLVVLFPKPLRISSIEDLVRQSLLLLEEAGLTV